MTLRRPHLIAAEKTDVAYTAHVKWGKIFNLRRESERERESLFLIGSQADGIDRFTQ